MAKRDYDRLAETVRILREEQEVELGELHIELKAARKDARLAKHNATRAMLLTSAVAFVFLVSLFLS